MNIGLKVASLALPTLVLGFGIPYEVYRYTKDRNIELPMILPELSDMEVEVYSPVETTEEQPVQRTTKKVWRQTGGRKFDSVFKVPKGVYTDAYLNGLCKSKIIPVIFRNWCSEAKFELKEA